jgi:hypothetical protein
MANRIYVVENDESVSLVRAGSSSKALRHVIQTNYKVHIASADEVAEYMGMGAVVEDATGESDDDGGNDPEAPPLAQ